ncbi:HesA/MoeB/ThiF family protein [Roseinatronobacter alkalisoli]|uniref:HesA/MoeB/ThiF family protein n=1 Tax=Roseinatronobacter alkalisoli TaxID=3028235 RepID=A0ABT5TCC1_9RHOB|nr:HesA/MoeB/ThiF family protein [Roseinatronobacter sp. HJB301]MDD7971568.1 HesA/MoeB/ThiF family protein [Roseinatronobacter sp. HJB301]
MTRYARQMVLPEIGVDGQARLARAHVLVVGAGGLGVPVLQYLAGAGVGRITLVDGDTVETFNLHRQPLYRIDQLGQSKALAAAAALSALNPDVAVTPRVEWLDPATAPALVAGADLVLDCADTFAASLTLSDICRDMGKPLITASALALSGYVAGCCGGSPSLRAIFPDLPERGATCATAGVMGPVVGAIGALQAQMALSVLLGLTPSPLGQLVSLDAVRWRMGGFRFDRAPEPPAPLPFIARGQICADDLLIDLRTEAPPFSPDARHIPPENITTLTPPADRRVVLACATGLRAHNAGQALQSCWQGEIALLALND